MYHISTMSQETFTVTFCDRAENHVGMQQIGQMAEIGFSLAELDAYRKKAIKAGYLATLYRLDWPLQNDEIDIGEPYVLVIRNAINTQRLHRELASLNWDKKAFMYGRVVNKKARHNLCFADFSQEPDYSNRQGRVIDFADLPELSKVRRYLAGLTGRNLVAEGNHYYDSSCGIGFHGDTERRLVAGVRIGATIPLVYQWHYQGQPVGVKMELELKDGDIYLMSDKAVGHDWKRKTIYTLRHAAGSEAFVG